MLLTKEKRICSRIYRVNNLEKAEREERFRIDRKILPIPPSAGLDISMIDPVHQGGSRRRIWRTIARNRISKLPITR